MELEESGFEDSFLEAEPKETGSGDCFFEMEPKGNRSGSCFLEADQAIDSQKPNQKEADLSTSPPPSAHFS